MFVLNQLGELAGVLVPIVFLAGVVMFMGWLKGADLNGYGLSHKELIPFGVKLHCPLTPVYSSQPLLEHSLGKTVVCG